MPLPTADELVARYADQIKGKVVITTGVSPKSLGAYFVQAIAKAHPAWIILAGRSPKKAEQTEEVIKASNPEVKTRFLHLDLASLQSARDAAATVNGWSDIPVVDVLVNNAGMMSHKYAVTVDGFELSLASNHLGHFLFTNLIMDKILASSAPRIVSVSSHGHRMEPFRFRDYNFDDGKTFSPFRAYGQTKTANILFAISLVEKLEKRNLQAYSLHPGTILTNGVENVDFSQFLSQVKALDCYYAPEEGPDDSIGEVLPIEQGTATHVYAAFDPNLKAHNGKYLFDCRVSDPLNDPIKPWATSPYEAERLWRLTEKLVGQKFSY